SLANWRNPRSVEKGVSVLATFVSELRDRGHALVVVRLDLVEVRPHPVGGARAEGLRYVALLTGRLHALLLEDLADTRQDGDLGVDVRHRVGEPLLHELLQRDAPLMGAKLVLNDATQPLD